MAKQIFNITQEHIDKGEAGSDTHCPIALCAKEAGFDGVMVEMNTIEFYNEEGESRYSNLPKKARQFISKFVDLKPVKPFSFTIYGV